MLNTTRLEQPIPYTLLEERTGLPWHTLQQTLQQAQKLELVTCSDHTWSVTSHGRRYTNDLQALFLPGEVKIL